MPLYNYKCKNCAKLFDATRKIADRMSAPCPHCEGEGVKQLSAPIVTFPVGDSGFAGNYMKWARDRTRATAKQTRKG